MSTSDDELELDVDLKESALSSLDDSALQDGDDSDEEALLTTKPKLAFYSGSWFLFCLSN